MSNRVPAVAGTTLDKSAGRGKSGRDGKSETAVPDATRLDLPKALIAQLLRLYDSPDPTRKGRVLRGYDPARVEEFRDQVADELERLTRLNQDLEQKARGFHDQLKSFRDRDKALNEALISAQQLRGEIREQAEREAQLAVREAQAESERLLAGAQADIRRAEDELAALERFRRNYLTQLRVFVERQLAEITAAEASPSIQRTRSE